MDGKIVVENVEFLTPAKVTISSESGTTTEIVSVDLVNRKVYLQTGELCPFAELVLKHLDNASELPENLFEASPDIYDRLVELNEEQNRLRGEFHGR